MYNITFDKNHRISKNYDNAQIPGNNRYSLQKIARFQVGKKKKFNNAKFNPLQKIQIKEHIDQHDQQKT